MPKKIALVGGGRSNILTPIKDSNVEKWILPISCPNAFPFADVMFDLHEYIWDINSVSWEQIKPEDRRGVMKKYRNMLRSSRVPVFMTKHYKDIPMSRPFPFKDMVDRFGTYFDNSVSWMLAMAITKVAESKGEYDTIQMFGMEFNEERYKFGKGVCEFYLGIIQGLKAMGMPIKLEISPSSSLLRTHDGLLYGINIPPSKLSEELRLEEEAREKAVKDFDEFVNKQNIETMNQMNREKAS